MKTLLFLLFPLFLFSQNFSCPDTVLLKNHESYPCLVTSLDESMVYVLLCNNNKSATSLNLVQRISLAKWGDIYHAGEGYLIDKDSIDTYVAAQFKARQKEQARLERQQEQTARKQKRLKDENRQEREQALKQQRENLERKYALKRKKLEMEQQQEMMANRNALKLLDEDFGSSPHRWSFGLYVASYAPEKVKQYLGDPYYTVELIYANQQKMLTEAQLSWRVVPRFRILLDAGYTIYSSKYRYESYTSGNNPGQVLAGGQESISDNRIFIFDIAFKYYFNKLETHRVSPWILAGAGKQFAFANQHTEYLFTSQNPYQTTDDNKNEFLEQLNSPLRLKLAFGAEYAFNKSLSLFSSVRLIYSHRSGTYKYSNDQPGYLVRQRREVKFSQVETQLGMGINFYF